MVASFAREFPEGLVQALWERDRATGSTFLQSEDERRQVIEWLRRVFVDFTALNDHIRRLEKLYGATFQFPPSRRDRWDGDEAPTISNEFPYREPLTDARIAGLADSGVECLDNVELGTLMLNPLALFDIHDVIDDLLPEYWVPILHKISVELGGTYTVGREPPYSLDKGVSTSPGSVVSKSDESNSVSPTSGHSAKKPLMTAWLGGLALAASIASIAVGFSILHRQGEIGIELAALRRQVGAENVDKPIELQSGNATSVNWDDIAAFLDEAQPESSLKQVRNIASRSQLAILDEYASLGLNAREVIRCVLGAINKRQEQESQVNALYDKANDAEKARIDELRSKNLSAHDILAIFKHRDLR